MASTARRSASLVCSVPVKDGGGGEVGDTGEKASLTGVLNALTDVLVEEVGSERAATRRERKVSAMMGGAGRGGGEVERESERRRGWKGKRDRDKRAVVVVSKPVRYLPLL